MLSMLSLVAAAGLMAAESKSSLVIGPCDSGEQFQFAVVECPIPLQNLGDKPIQVSKARSLVETDWIQEEIIVPPHSTAYLTTKVQLLGGLGHVRHPFQFATDEHGQEVRGSHVRAFVLSDLDVGKPILDFGTVFANDQPPTSTINLSSKETESFRVLSVLSKPDYMDVQISKDGQSIEAKLKPDAPWGIMRDQRIELKINAPHQDRAWIGVGGQVLGDVVAATNPYSMGLIRTGDKKEFLIRLSSRSKKEFKLGRVTLDGIQGESRAMECVPSDRACKLVQVKISDKQPTGRVSGKLQIELPDQGKILPVELTGILIEDDVPVHDLNKELEKAASVESPISTPAAPQIGVRDAIRSAVGAEADPPGDGPLLRWSVANERSIYGYQIYRSEHEGGPFLRVNDAIMQASNTKGVPGQYVWRDSRAASGKTYWYYIGMVKHDGTKQDLTAPQKFITK